MFSTGKRLAIFGILITLMCLCLLAASVATLMKLYGLSTAPVEVTERARGPEESESRIADQPQQKLEQVEPDLESSVNIPKPLAIKPVTKNREYEAYLSYVQLLHSSLNLSFNPCDNFYEYACGNHRGEDAYVRLNLENFHLLSDRFVNKASSYSNNAYLPRGVRQAAILNNKCLANGGKVTDPQRVDSKLEALSKRLGGIPFPAISPTPVSSNGINSNHPLFDLPPSATTLATVLGYLNYAEDLPTLVPSFVDTNWLSPHGGQPYQLYIDQPWLMHRDAHYRYRWEEVKEDLLNETYSILSTYASYKKVAINDTQLRRDAQAILDFEFAITTAINTPQAQRFNRSLRYNQFSVREAMAAFPLFNFSAYLTAAIPLMPAHALGEAVDDYHFVVEYPSALNRLLQLLYNGPLAPRTLYNYLYFRLLRQNFAYLPHQPNVTGLTNEEFQEQMEIHQAYAMLESMQTLRSQPAERQFDRRSLWPGHSPWQYFLPLPHLRPNSALAGYMRSLRLQDDIAVNWIVTKCMWQNVWMMNHANSRAFIDAHVPSSRVRARIQRAVGGVMGRVIAAFQEMLHQLEWMSEESKRAALSKVRSLVKVVAYPEWVLDDTALDAFYATLPVFDDSASYTTMVDAVAAYNRNRTLNLLLLLGNGSDTFRGHFPYSPALANGWYQHQINSLAVSLGLLQPPFFHLDYPASVNYGALGAIVGHELAHAFDALGIQYDATGVLTMWMDAESRRGFNHMASCLVEQFNEYEKASISQGYKDGLSALHEKIADGGGIQASYKAFEAYRAVHGPDPQLPDDTYQVFSHDQLFFLAYAHQWCQAPRWPRETAEQRNKYYRSFGHSPNKYRLLDTLRNFPAFRTAFNCEVDSVYAPQQHCQVWISDTA